MVRSQIAPNAVVAKNPDFGQLAAAYDIGYTAPQSLDDIAPALRAALGRSGPTLIHLRSDVLI